MELIRAGQIGEFLNSGVTSRQLLFPENSSSFEDGDLHGFENTGSADFKYLSVTSPPVNFRGAYERDWSGNVGPERLA